MNEQPLPEVELYQVFEWKCACGAKNHCPSVLVDLGEEAFPPEMVEEVRAERAAGLDSSLCAYAAPDAVTCSACGQRSRTKAEEPTPEDDGWLRGALGE